MCGCGSMGVAKERTCGRRGALWLLFALCWVLPCRGEWIFDGKPSTWEGTQEELLADEYTYPVLRLELGGQWTDFELKASTNNFESLVYYIKSSSATAGGYDDTDVWTYFTDDYSTDVRQWLKASVATAIGGQLTDPVNSVVSYVVVCPSHSCDVDYSTWMSKTNERLVWSYVRYDGMNLETNVTGTKTRWNPVVPTEWRSGRIAP